MEESSFLITILMVVTVLSGIGAQVLGIYLKIPSIVFLLVFGILLGPDCLDLLHPQLLGEGLESLVSLSVALILFEGGLNLQLRDLAKISKSLRNLVTLGLLITLSLGGVAAHYLVDLPWNLAFLYASLVVVTGPTVIGPLLRQVQVDRQVATLLEGEGVLIDPLGAIVAVVILNVVLSGGADASTWLTGLITRLSIGAAIGGAGGWLLGWFLKQADPLSADMKNLVVLASVWSLYGLAQYVRDESGLMAAVVAGIVLSADANPELRSLRRFQGQLTILAVSVLFILLAADLPLVNLTALGWGGVFTVLTLMLVVRPLSIWVCTWSSDLNWRQKTFISWVGPKGIVSASVASLFAIFLAEEGIPAGEMVKALVFLTIMMTVLLQGTTARWLANRLRLTAEQAKGAVIVGSNPLARLVARLFKERDEPAVLIDTNPAAIQQARQEELDTVWDSAMDPEVLERAGMDSMGTFLSMTTNGEVNHVLAERAVEEFDPPRVLAVFPPSGKPQKTRAQQAFVFDLSLQTWNDYLQSESVKLIETTLEDPGFNYQQTYLQALIDSGKLIPLLLARRGRLQVVQAGQLWQTGDRVICLLQNPKSKLMKQLSGGSHLNLERVPTVQEVPLPAGVLTTVKPANP